MATLEQRLAERLAPRTLTTRIVALFAAFAALLSALGIYATVSYVLAERRRDFGLRIALGAQRRDVVRLVLRGGLLLCGAGVLLGSLAALGLSRLMTSLLFGVSAASPSIYAAVALFTLVTAAAACAPPAWRAARVDPMLVLRA